MRTFIPRRFLPFIAIIALLAVSTITTHAASSPNTWTVTGSLNIAHIPHSDIAI